MDAFNDAFMIFTFWILLVLVAWTFFWTSSYVTLEHKTSLESLGYICSNSQQYIVWVKIIDFSIMPKIIRILRSCSMKIFCKFPTVNISKLWLVIFIAKNLILTTLKVIFSIFRFFFFAPSDSRFSNSCISAKYCPIINHTSMERLFINLSDDVYISIENKILLWLVLCSRVTFVFPKFSWVCNNIAHDLKCQMSPLQKKAPARRRRPAGGSPSPKADAVYAVSLNLWTRWTLP